jgi:pimeloyl-ACP methyl ester carboxylesterase
MYPSSSSAANWNFWSRPVDVTALARDLINAPKVRTVTIPGSTHYLLLDRPDHGKKRFVAEVLKFLSR